MTRIGAVMLIAMAVVGIVANSGSGQDTVLVGIPEVGIQSAAGGGGSEVVAPRPGMAPGAASAPTDSVQLGPAPATVALASEPPEFETARGQGLLDPALVPPATHSVRLLNRLPTQQKVVNLTFDVEGAPGPAKAILAALKAEGVKGSFGLTGTFVQANPDVVRQMVNEGHDIFNHTYSHPALATIGQPQRRGQLRQMEEKLIAAVGQKPVPVFRPPYGSYNTAALQDIGAMGYRWVLLWDVDPQGFRGYAPAVIASTALRQATAGSIILMHGIPQDAAALPSLIRGLKARGLGFVTVSQALGLS